MTHVGTPQGGDRIILLTDGGHNEGPGPTDYRVLAELNRVNAFVDTIGFTSAADKSMVNKRKYTCNLVMEHSGMIMFPIRL